MSMTNIIPELWARELVELLPEKTPMLGLVNTNIAGEASQIGDTLHIIGAADVTVNTYTSGAITYADPTDTTSDLSVNFDRYVAFKVEDTEKNQTRIDWQSAYQRRATERLADALETNVLADHASWGTDNYETGKLVAA